MAFGYTVTKRTVIGNVRTVYGTYTNSGGSTGGDIVTGLTGVDHISLTQVDSSVAANAPVPNETFPGAPGAVTIVTDANKNGTYWAVGR